MEKNNNNVIFEATTMNKGLLKQLYSIYSPSGFEKKMRKYVERKVVEYGGTYTIDKYGNLLVTKGVSDTYPCVAAHLDQVQDVHAEDFTCIESHGAVFGYSRGMRMQQGLGADDKNGIFICLECLKKYDVLKAAFFVGEETGCDGSGLVDLDFFKDCRFIVEPDRRGHSDLITSMWCGRVCSDDFIEAINADMFGYKEEKGSVTDVGELVKRGVGISCLNLSCGYYEAHTDCEFTVLEDLEKCLLFVQNIIETCTDVYPFKYEAPVSKGFGSGLDKYHWSDGWYDRYYEDYDYGYGSKAKNDTKVSVVDQTDDVYQELLTDYNEGMFVDFSSYKDWVNEYMLYAFPSVHAYKYAELWNTKFGNMMNDWTYARVDDFKKSYAEREDVS